MEYVDILAQASKTEDQALRLAMVAVFGCTITTITERNTSKPFNPLLGETYEYITDDFEFLSEQVSHHPPVVAAYCKGKKSNYVFWTNQKTNTKFNGKGMDFTQQYRSYVDMPELKERYEIQAPTLSLHNLIVGTMYVDIGGLMKVRLLENPNLFC